MITRIRLLERMSSNPGQNRWLIEAGAGFGKTVLLDHLRGSLVESLIIVRRPTAANDLLGFFVELSEAAHRAGHTETAQALSGAEGNPRAIAQVIERANRALAIDDVHLWGDDVAQLLVKVIAEVSNKTPLLIAGRFVPKALDRFRSDPSWRHVGPNELSLTLDETGELLRQNDLEDATASLVLHQLSHGWPLAVASACARISRSPDPTALLQEMGRQDSLIENLLKTQLDGLGPHDVQAARTLATLPFFDERTAEIVGTAGLLKRLAAAGIPLTRRLDGWSEIADQFRTAITRHGQSVAAPRSVITHFVDRGEVHAAINTCLAAGNRELAAQVIADLTLDQEARLDPSALNAALMTIGDAASIAPRCLHVHAHVLATFGRTDEGLPYLERAIEMFTEQDPQFRTEAHLEALLTLGVWRLFDGRDPEAEEICRTCESHIDDESLRLVAMLHDLRGVIHHAGGTDGDLEQATVELTAALTIWRQLEEPRAAAVTMFRLAAGVLDSRGRPADALALLDSLPSVGPMTLMNSARWGLERAILLPKVGRAAEVHAVLEEPRRIASLMGHDWLLGWSMVAEMVAASVVGNCDRVDELASEFGESGLVIFSDVTQAYRWCEIADALARCGRYDAARQTLDRVALVDGVPDWLVAYNRALLDARGGDAVDALRVLDEIAALDHVERSERWKLDLFRAVCHWRLDQATECDRFLDLAFEEAERLAAPSMPAILEHRLVERMRSGPNPPEVTARVVEIALFGEFSVSVNGQRVGVRVGQPSTLIKVLTLGGGRLIVDQVIDPLWPEADLEVGRRRLRNVLKRVRESCGDIIERAGDALVLAEGVSSDHGRAIDACTAALESGASPSAVERAIGLNGGEMLPDDRYDDWAIQARSDQHARLVQLLDRQAELAEAAGDVDLAVAALERAHSLDVFDRGRLPHALGLLRGAGRTAAAVALERRH